MARLCDPIESTDMGQLANALGLDSSRFRHRSSHGNGSGEANGSGGNDFVDEEMENDMKILSLTDKKEKFRDCHAFEIKCNYCNATVNFKGVWNEDLNHGKGQSGLKCTTPNCIGIVNKNYGSEEYYGDISRIKNSIQLQLWKYIHGYYSREWKCIDATCNYTTRQLNVVHGNQCPKIGCHSIMKETYSAQELFEQIRYFHYLFDIKSKRDEIKQANRNDGTSSSGGAGGNGGNNITLDLNFTDQQAFDAIYNWIEKYILHSSKYYFIDSNILFRYLK